MSPRVGLGLIVIVLLVAAAAAFTGDRPAPLAPSGKLPVVASFYPLWFFSQQIGGDRAQVSNITPAGAEPHDYEPTAQNIAQIERSRLLVLNGAGLEPWADSLRQSIHHRQTLIVVAGEGFATQQLTENGQTHIDPHVWLSPIIAKQIVDKVAASFAAADPADEPYFAANAAALKAKLDALDQAFRQGLANCRLKDIVTAHAAFGYLAAAYHLNQVAIAGLSPDAEPSAPQLTAIAQFVKMANIRYILFENLISPKLAQTIATETGAQALELNPLEGLTGAELSQGEDYFTQMARNLDHLQTALQCQP